MDSTPAPPQKQPTEQRNDSSSVLMAAADSCHQQDGFFPQGIATNSSSDHPVPLEAPNQLSFSSLLSSTGAERFVAASTPLDRFSECTFETSQHQRSMQKDRPPSCPPALKDRSNQAESPASMDIDATSKPRLLARSASRSTKRSFQSSSPVPARFSMAAAADDDDDASTDQARSSHKKAKSHTPSSSKRSQQSVEHSERGKTGVQHLMRSSAQFLGSTLQSAFTLTNDAKTNNSSSNSKKKQQQNARLSMTPQKRKLPSIDKVADIRKLVHQYTLLDPLDRQDSAESLRIQSITGYTLNPPLVSLLDSAAPARSPIQTRSGKLETLLKLKIDLAELDACKNRDQQLAETCTQCRYERDGYTYRFLYVPSQTLISAEQYEARYLVMLQQICSSRSEYWGEYFAKLYATADNGSVLSTNGLGAIEEEEELMDRDDEGDGGQLQDALELSYASSTRVLVDGKDSEPSSINDTADTGTVNSGKDDRELTSAPVPTSNGTDTVVILEETKLANGTSAQSGTTESNTSLPITGNCISASSLAKGQLIVSMEAVCDVPGHGEDSSMAPN